MELGSSLRDNTNSECQVPSHNAPSSNTRRSDRIQGSLIPTILRIDLHRNFSMNLGIVVDGGVSPAQVGSAGFDQVFDSA